ncbi:MAG: hypothetical protein VZQ47_08670 [Treponema sp.]|nr:hypothetical protein [Treponema sp.]MEE3435615.1 hypothetical protein [Treponema sp.]
MSEWRDIWKKSIIASKNSIIKKDQKLKFFFKDLENDYPDDKMVLFEEAITLDCLKNYDKAIELYEYVSMENTGLPVKHWRDAASFLLEICKIKKSKFPFPEDMKNLLKSGRCTDLLYRCEWNSFFLLHSYVNLPNHIRYLAISSMTRIDSESEASAIIFRTCMEEAYKKLYSDLPDSPSWLNDFICDSDLLISSIQEHSKIIQKNGNSAAHEGILLDELDTIITSFMEVMKFCNDAFYKN